MRATRLFTAALLLLGQSAMAAATWSVISFTTTAQSAPRVLAAADKLMNSAVGKQFPGKLLLQVHLADGSDPGTHSFVPIYKTVADREAFVQKLQADPAWTQFQATMAKETQPAASVLYRTVKSWGDIVDTDHVWETHAFKVTDPAALVAALDKFIGSGVGKQFPGQVYLSEVVAGGLSPVTHVISVGFASEVEMDWWRDVRDPSSEWAKYLAEARKASEYLGTNLVRDLKSWGPASLKGITTR